ncbi:MAG TPA: glycerophosphodiester phosphodiesterase [Acidimicrobiia bacterium]|nr:glycerophosphodiester phosphodiesterase [Acidimicrobiia bacterium]
MGVAHRGSRLLWPENTMTAFRAAAEHGYRLFETDVRVTADAEVVAFHDGALDRTTNGSGPLTAATWDQVAQLDAGFNHRLRGSFPFRDAGVRVPRFAEVAEAFPDHGLIVDLKAEGTVEPLVRTLFEMEMTERVIVGSFSGERLERFRHLTGDSIATSTSPQETIEAVAAASTGGRLAGPAAALQIPVTWSGVPVLTRRLVEAAHAGGRLVHVWTINRRIDMERCLDLGVDGLITDRPDLLKELLA